MKSIAVFLLFVGMFLIVQGYYSEVSGKCPPPKVEVKYVPLAIYEEQLSGKDRIQQQFKSLFEDASPRV